MANRFCESCGAAIVEGSKFCEGCGAAISEPGSSALQVPVQPQSAPQTPPPSTPSYVPQPSPQTGGSGMPNQKLLIGIGAVVALAVIGFAGWQLLGKKEPPKDEANPAQTQKQNPVANAPDPNVTVTSSQDGEAFIGRWFPEETSGAEPENNILTFSRQGSKIVGVSNKDTEGRLELDVAPGDKLTGEFVDAKGERTPVAAEMLSDGQKMVLTISPPASEPDTVILWKVKEGEAPSQKGVSETAPSATITKDQATDIVAKLEDVDKFCKLLEASNKRAVFDTTEEDANTWMVHVYEIVDDGEGMSHTATFGWFKVDRKTGKVTPGME